MSIFENIPWAMEPKALQALIEKVETKSFFNDYDKEESYYNVEKGVAKIPLKGSIVENPGWWARYLGATDPQEVIAAIEKADQDPMVKTLELDVNSPGGTSSAGKKLYDFIAKRDSEKPLNACIGQVAASAAMWAIAGCDEIRSGLLSMIGSIGVYSVLYDKSDMAKQQGIKVKLVNSNEYKGMGVSGTKITDKQEANIREMVLEAARYFEADMKEGRPGIQDEALSGKIFHGEKAQQLGLIDKIGNDENSQEEMMPTEMERLQAEYKVLQDENSQLKSQLGELKKQVDDVKTLKASMETQAVELRKMRGDQLISQYMASGHLQGKHLQDAEGKDSALKQMAYHEPSKFSAIVATFDVVQTPKTNQGSDHVEDPEELPEGFKSGVDFQAFKQANEWVAENPEKAHMFGSKYNEIKEHLIKEAK